MYNLIVLEEELKLEIISLDKVESTQKYLIEKLEENSIKAPIAIIAHEQISGVGSRENSWTSAKGDFLVSFALPIDELPKDLPLASSSIYFAFIMKELLIHYHEGIWIKWPNDIYYQEDKIGGVITKKVGQSIVCGIGINLKKNSNAFKALDIGLQPIFLLQKYLAEVKKNQNWKQIFMKYKLEFNNNKNISTHVLGQQTSLQNAFLCDDGSLIINKKRIYSLR